MIDELHLNHLRFLQSLDELKAINSAGSAKTYLTDLNEALENIRSLTYNEQVRDYSYRIMLSCLMEFLAYLDANFGEILSSEQRLYRSNIIHQIKFYESITN